MFRSFSMRQLRNWNAFLERAKKRRLPFALEMRAAMVRSTLDLRLAKGPSGSDYYRDIIGAHISLNAQLRVLNP